MSNGPESSRSYWAGREINEIEVLWDMADLPIPDGYLLQTVFARMTHFFERSSVSAQINFNCFCPLSELSPGVRSEVAYSVAKRIEIANGNSISSRESAILLRLLLWTLEESGKKSAICLVISERLTSVISAIKSMIELRNVPFLIVHPSDSQPPGGIGCHSVPFHVFCDIPLRNTAEPSKKLSPTSKSGYGTAIGSDESSDSMPSLARNARKNEPNLRRRKTLGLSSKEKQFLLKVLKSLEKDKLPPTQEMYLARIQELSGEFPDTCDSFLSMIERGLSSGDLVDFEKKGEVVLLPDGMPCWKFVDWRISGDRYPQNIWDALKLYLKTSRGRMRIEVTESSYQAAKVLRKHGPQELRRIPLGEVVHLVRLAVTEAKWLSTLENGWSPVTVTLPESDQESDSDSVATNPKPSQQGHQNTTSENIYSVTRNLPEIRSNLSQLQISREGEYRQQQTAYYNGNPNGPRFPQNYNNWNRPGMAPSFVPFTNRPPNPYQVPPPGYNNYSFGFSPNRPGMQHPMPSNPAPESFPSRGPVTAVARPLSLQPALTSLASSAAIAMDKRKEEISKFRRWLVIKIWRLDLTKRMLEISQIEDLYLKDTGCSVSLSSWGFKSVDALIESMAEVANLDYDTLKPRAIIWPATPTLSDLADTITEELKKEKHGADLAQLKDVFRTRNGYDLDQKCLGFPTVKSLLSEMPEVCDMSVNGPTTKIVKPKKNGAR